MEILPENLSKKIQLKLEEQNISPEFLTLVGMISYYGEDAWLANLTPNYFFSFGWMFIVHKCID